MFTLISNVEYNLNQNDCNIYICNFVLRVLLLKMKTLSSVAGSGAGPVTAAADAGLCITTDCPAECRTTDCAGQNLNFKKNILSSYPV